MIARHLAIACLIYTVLAVQPGLSNDIAAIGFRPWLPGIALVACVLLTNDSASLVWAGVLGFGVDCQSLDRLGVNVVVATIVASGLMRAKSDNRPQGAISVVVLVFVGTFVWRIAGAIVHGLLDGQSFDVVQLVTFASLAAVGTSVLSLCLSIGGRLLLAAGTSQRTSARLLNNHWSMLTGK